MPSRIKALALLTPIIARGYRQRGVAAKLAFRVLCGEGKGARLIAVPGRGEGVASGKFQRDSGLI